MTWSLDGLRALTKTINGAKVKGNIVFLEDAVFPVFSNIRSSRCYIREGKIDDVDVYYRFWIGNQHWDVVPYSGAHFSCVRGEAIVRKLVEVFTVLKIVSRPLLVGPSDER